MAGGLACGIYTTNGADSVEYKLRHSRANIMVVEEQEQLDKVNFSLGLIIILFHHFLGFGYQGQII